MRVIKSRRLGGQAEIYGQLGPTLTYHPAESGSSPKPRPPRSCT
jgi:hypothetical protein